MVVHGAKREHSTVTLNSLPRISPGSLTPQPSSMRGGTCPLLPLKMQGESPFFFLSSFQFFCVFFLSFFLFFVSILHRLSTNGRRNSFSFNVQFIRMSFIYLGDSKIIVLLPRYRRRDVSRAYAHVAYPAPPAET